MFFILELHAERLTNVSHTPTRRGLWIRATSLDHSVLKTGFAYLGVIFPSPAEIKGSGATTRAGYKVCVPGACTHAGGQNKSETSLKYRARHTLCTRLFDDLCRGLEPMGERGSRSNLFRATFRFVGFRWSCW